MGLAKSSLFKCAGFRRSDARGNLKACETVHKWQPISTVRFSQVCTIFDHPMEPTNLNPVDDMAGSLPPLTHIYINPEQQSERYIALPNSRILLDPVAFFTVSR